MTQNCIFRFFSGLENFTRVCINLAPSMHVHITLFTSYSRLIKSSLVRLSSALVTASEFTGKSILPDIKTQNTKHLLLNITILKLGNCSRLCEYCKQKFNWYWRSCLRRVKIADSHPWLLKEPHIKFIVILIPYCLNKETRSIHKYCAMERRQLVVNREE